MWMLIRVEFWRNNRFWMDWVYNWWFNMMIMMARIDMLGVLIVVMWVFMMRIFASIDIWFYETRVILCSWNAVNTPRMIEDLEEVIFWNAQIVIVANLMKWVLHWIWACTASSQAELKLKEASASLLVPYIFVLSAMWKIVAESGISNWSVGGDVDSLSMHWGFFNDLDLLFRSSFSNWLSWLSVLPKSKSNESFNID